MENFQIFLSGACKNVEDYGAAWRLDADQKFLEVSDVSSYRIVVFNPNDYFSYDVKLHQTERQVRDFYLSMIDRSDLVLVNISDTNSSPGTAMEVQRAVDSGIPIIGFGSHIDAYSWIRESCQVVFDSLNQAVQYITRYYLIN